MLGRRSYSFDASLFDGHVVGFTEMGKTAERYQARVTGIDLSRAGVVRAATGLDLAGILSGSLDVTLDPKDPSKSTGEHRLPGEGRGHPGRQDPGAGDGRAGSPHRR